MPSATYRPLRQHAAFVLVAALIGMSTNAAFCATVEQPLPFSHRHHVSQLGLDCRACHATVDISATAGMPSDTTCTNCHAHLVNDPAARDPAHAGLTSTAVRAARRPDFVNFDHSLHGSRGVACVACHGDVEHALSAQTNPLTTGWCADCHRHRERIASRIGRNDTGTRSDAAAQAASATRTNAPDMSCNVHLQIASNRCNPLISAALFSGM